MCFSSLQYLSIFYRSVDKIPRLMTRKAALCTVLSTRIAICLKLHIDLFSAHVFTGYEVLFYCCVQACRSRTNAAQRSIRGTYSNAQRDIVFCTVHTSDKLTDAARRLILQKVSCHAMREGATVPFMHVAIPPALRVDRIATRMLTRNAAVCYCTVHTR